MFNLWPTKLPRPVSRPAVFFFLVCAAAFGGVLLFLTPPYQGPDEPNHLYRAYAISTGEWEVDTITRRRGGEVPVSFYRMFETFTLVRWNDQVQTDFDSVRQYADLPLRPEQTRFVDYPNTAVYPAPVYLPAAVGLWGARKLRLSTLDTLYAARAGGLIFWLLAGALALWLLPFGRWLFAALMLLPMTVFTHSIVSADTFTNSVAFVTIAYLLRLAYRPGQRVRVSQSARLAGLAGALTTAKLVYAPLLLLGLLIPARRFTNHLTKWMVALALVAVVLGTAAFWSTRSAAVYLARAAYDPTVTEELHLPEGADVNWQRAVLLDHPERYALAIRNSLVDAAEMYTRAYIGDFGWLDLGLKPLIFGLAYAYLGLVLWFGGHPRIYLRWNDRLVFFIAAALCYCLVVLSQLLSWEGVGSTTVGTIQGRYLVPFAPLLFLVFFRQRVPWRWLPLLVVSGTTVLLLYSTYIIYLRYYVGWVTGSYLGH